MSSSLQVMLHWAQSKTVQAVATMVPKVRSNSCENVGLPSSIPLMCALSLGLLHMPETLFVSPKPIDDDLCNSQLRCYVNDEFSGLLTPRDPLNPMINTDSAFELSQASRHSSMLPVNCSKNMTLLQ